MKIISLLIILVGILAVGCDHKTEVNTNPVTLDELNSDLTMIMTHTAGRLPDTNQMTILLSAMGKSFPTAPPGKKIVLDPVAKQYVFVDQ